MRCQLLGLVIAVDLAIVLYSVLHEKQSSLDSLAYQDNLTSLTVADDTLQYKSRSDSCVEGRLFKIIIIAHESILEA
jgi:hypothetical protein